MGLSMIMFCGFLAMAVDIGQIYLVKGELQKAADAGALAGAQAFGSNSDWSQVATSVVTQNSANGLALTDCQVTSGYWSLVSNQLYTSPPNENPAPASAIQVVVAMDTGQNGGPLSLFFAPIIGIQPMPITAVAVALTKSSGIWSILETGNGTVTISGTAAVNGSVGVSSGGQLKMQGSATVKGKAYLNTGATKSFGSSTSVQGGVQQDSGANAIVAAAVASATTAYNNFKALTKTLGPTSINLTGIATATYTGGTGVNVMVLSSLNLGNSAVLYLNAPAGGSFVIVDSGAFTLSGTGKIVLQGGLSADDVTYVNTGTSTVSVGNSCIIQGNILSPKGAISLSGAATYNGTLIGGKAISVGNSVISLQTTWLPAPGGGGQGAALVQ